MSDVVAISDLHCPFQHRHAWDFLKEIKRKYKPDQAVCLGDEADQCHLSDHDQDPDGMSPGAEGEAAVEELQNLFRIFPEAVSVKSNHTDRIYRKAFKHGIPRAYLRSYKEFLHAPPGWEWADYVEIDGVIYRHGDPYGGPDGMLKMARDLMQSVCGGHIHTEFSIKYLANAKHLIVAVSGGCLIDRRKYAFQYAEKQGKKPIIGTPIIRDGVPTLIPMVLNSRGEWNGEV